MPITKYFPLEFKPGIRRNLTEYAEEGTWFSMDKVRFRDGKPQTIGGWQAAGGGAMFKGIARNAKDFQVLDGTKYMGFGTNNHFYLWAGGSYYDITPIYLSASTSQAFGITLNSTSVSVSIASHGRQAGDFFIVDSCATILGLGTSLSGEYEITSIPDANHFVINVSITATGTSTSVGGAPIGYRFPIGTGIQDTAITQGWGRSGWGLGTWGMAATASAGVVVRLRTWSIDNFGEDLLFNYRAGPLYRWDASNGPSTRAILVTAAPSVIDFSFVHNDTRQLMALGTIDIDTSAYDPLLIRWSDFEDYNSWIPSPVSAAGFNRIQGGSYFTGFCESKAATLISTNEGVYSVQVAQAPDYFSFPKLGSNCGFIGPWSAVDANGVVYWMGRDAFYVYDGAIRQLNCDIQKDLFDEDGELKHDDLQHDKIYAGLNNRFNEVIWFYQSVSSSTGDVDRYITYNYADDAWSYGTLTRSVWRDATLFDSPVAFGEDGITYYHELGQSADNDSINSYIESAAFDIGDGDSVMFIDRVVPDFEITGSLNIYIKTRKYPNGEETIKGPYLMTSDTEKLDIRARGRQAKVRLETSTSNSFWRMGKPRLRMKENGRN